MSYCDKHGHHFGIDQFCIRCNTTVEEYHYYGAFRDKNSVAKVSVKTDPDKKWLDRAKALLQEKKITTPEEAYVVAEILEEEMEVNKFDKGVIDLLVVALRENERTFLGRHLLVTAPY